MSVTRSDIEKYLSDVRRAVSTGRYQISSRQKNQDLYVNYVFKETDAVSVILSLTVEDFSDVVHNDHVNYPEEMLYIFGKDIELLPRFGGTKKMVSLYIKFNKLENQYVVVISFHEQEYPLRYKFK